MRVFHALSETEQIKKMNQTRASSQVPTSSRVADKPSVTSLKVDEHFFRSMGLIDVIGHLLRNGGEVTKLLALGETLSPLHLCVFLADTSNIRDPGESLPDPKEYFSNSELSW